MEKVKVIDEELYFDLLRKINKKELIKLFNNKKISFEELLFANGRFISQSKFKKYLKHFEYMKIALKTYEYALLHLSEKDIQKIGNENINNLIEELIKNEKWTLNCIPHQFQTKDMIIKALLKDCGNFVYIENNLKNEYEIQKYTFDLYKMQRTEDLSTIMSFIFYNTELNEKIQKEIKNLNNQKSLLEIINPIDEIILDLVNVSDQVLRRIAYKTKYSISEKSFKLIWDDFYQKNQNLEENGEMLVQLINSNNLESYMLSIIYDSIKDSKELKCIFFTDLVVKNPKFNLAKLVVDNMC